MHFSLLLINEIYIGINVKFYKDWYKIKYECFKRMNWLIIFSKKRIRNAIKMYIDTIEATKYFLYHSHSCHKCHIIAHWNICHIYRNHILDMLWCYSNDIIVIMKFVNFVVKSHQILETIVAAGELGFIGIFIEYFIYNFIYSIVSWIFGYY